MRDRLHELRFYDNDEAFPDLEVRIPGYVNAGYREEHQAALEDFFREVSQLSAGLDKLHELSEEIRGKQEQVLCSTSKDEVCGEKETLARLKEEFSRQARSIQDSLARMKEREAAAAAGDGAAGRMRRCQFNALLRRHTWAMGRHYAWETEYVARLREQIARQTQLAGLRLDEEEIQRLAESPHAPRLVGSDIQALEARRSLALVQERQQQLLALEEQVGELHNLFLALGAMVSEQQDQLDRIEYNVLRTVDYAGESSREMNKALQCKQQSQLAALASAVLALCTCCGCLFCMSRS
ncbi:hypothetical protein AAFF_G00311710 [Aldrovandia affinis]|uniref:t-SNARE coiled-coil homology domain-containing protein n=1 Tax=Aldrovandia affinis TaxID=143900 RepID=A0AAD7WRJ5_9TELE|nr:hypothetical protein AAFF_G00311710 [Aldrovandia affinis]